jgi:hypothetical protein
VSSTSIESPIPNQVDGPFPFGQRGGDVEGTIVSVDESQLIIAATPRQTALSKSQVCRVLSEKSFHLLRIVTLPDDVPPAVGRASSAVIAKW